MAGQRHVVPIHSGSAEYGAGLRGCSCQAAAAVWSAYAVPLGSSNTGFAFSKRSHRRVGSPVANPGSLVGRCPVLVWIDTGLSVLSGHALKLRNGQSTTRGFPASATLPRPWCRSRLRRLAHSGLRSHHEEKHPVPQRRRQLPRAYGPKVITFPPRSGGPRPSCRGRWRGLRRRPLPPC